MDVHASPDMLPELQVFLGSFQVRFRRALPAVHLEIVRWLRHQAVQWWVSTDRFIALCSQRL
jgi:hypothetical protein